MTVDLSGVNSAFKRRAIIAVMIVPYTAYCAVKFGWLGMRYGVNGVWGTAAIQWKSRTSETL